MEKEKSICAPMMLSLAPSHGCLGIRGSME